MKLWQPSTARITRSNMQQFQRQIFQKFSSDFSSSNTYQDLWQWSVMQKGKFWQEVAFFTGVKFHSQQGQVYQEAESFTESKFFEGYTLNYTQNLLKNPNQKQAAIIFWNEKGEKQSWSFQELSEKTAILASYFQELGLKKGDRIAAYMPNIPETVCVFLASASIGCIFCSCSSDFGVEGVVDRFSQIKPKLLAVSPEYFYSTKRIDIRTKIAQIAANLPSVEHKINFAYPLQEELKIVGFQQASSILKKKPPVFVYENFAFNHPLYILFSSGTTGVPKCIVHSSGGALIQQQKELQLHCDLLSGMKIFFYTTCGWMMWNWQVAALAGNATICLFDGSPVSPPKILWDFVEQEKIDIFGLGSKVVDFYKNKNFNIQTEYTLSNLKTMLTTGSVLSHECFTYIYQLIKEDLHLASISGGTDIVSCFLLGNPNLAVYSGELQCAGLGMDVDVFTSNGKSSLEKGELVCKSPFPSKPLKFWNDTNGEKMHKAYFKKFANIWTHGDYVQKSKNGGFVIYGRSDTTLNPGGVRIGTAEIYRIVERLVEVEESIVIGQEWKGDIRIVLFVKLAPNCNLSEALVQKIKNNLKDKASFKHIPKKIIETKEIPRTRSGKIVELVVKNAVEGKPIENIQALANPDCLQYYRNITELALQ